MSRFRFVFRWLTVAVAVAAGVLVTPVTPAAPAQESQEVERATCPETAIVAARGSEQNHDLMPRRYAEGSPWVSNGYEASTISQFLDFAERRHRERTGRSLLYDVPVIALDSTVYPAALPLPSIAAEDERLPAVEALDRTTRLLGHVPLPEMATTVTTEFLDSVSTGIQGAGGYIADWEAATGCRPDYIFIGFSQGAMVLSAQESRFASEGRLRGVLYLGNPLLPEQDPSAVGNPGAAGGVFRALSPQWPEGVPPAPRINYFLVGDMFCDLNGRNLGGALVQPATENAHNLYFTGPEFTEDDVHVADIVAGWIGGGTG